MGKESGTCIGKIKKKKGEIHWNLFALWSRVVWNCTSWMPVTMSRWIRAAKSRRRTVRPLVREATVSRHRATLSPNTERLAVLTGLVSLRLKIFPFVLFLQMISNMFITYYMLSLHCYCHRVLSHRKYAYTGNLEFVFACSLTYLISKKVLILWASCAIQRRA